MNSLQKEGGILSPQKDPLREGKGEAQEEGLHPLQEDKGEAQEEILHPLEEDKDKAQDELLRGGDKCDAFKDDVRSEECDKDKYSRGQEEKVGLLETLPTKEEKEASATILADASHVELEGPVSKQKEPQEGGAGTGTLETPPEESVEEEGQADDRFELLDAAVLEGFDEKGGGVLQGGGTAEDGGRKHEQFFEEVGTEERMEDEQEGGAGKKDFGTPRENEKADNGLEKPEVAESDIRGNRLKQERFDARASMELATTAVVWRGIQGPEEPLQEPFSKEGAYADLTEIPNPPGSVGYFSQSASLKRAKESEQEAALKSSEQSLAQAQLTDALGGLQGGASSPAGQPDAATWQQQVDRLSENGQAEGRARKGEGLQQDLNVEWVASVAEADQAQNAVTKNLEAQLVLLQKVAATRYGEESEVLEAPEKESHADTMRKLKAELAALEEKAAAQKLMKRQPGFAELRTSSERAPASEKAPEKRGRPAKKPRERYWKLSDEEIQEGLEAKRKRRPNGLYMCQVEGCDVNLENAKAYNKRHHVCWEHSRAWEVNINGLVSRFCQQCSRFHDVRDFDEIKRSCRERLLHHNKRRRTVADPNRKDFSEASAEVEAAEAPSKDGMPKPRKQRATTRDPSAIQAEPDPVQKALYTLVRAREHLGGAENPLGTTPPDRLASFGGLRQNDFRAPGTYGVQPRLDGNPASEMGVSRLASLRHDSTELTLARRGSGLSGFAENSVHNSPAMQHNPVRLSQNLAESQPVFPQSYLPESGLEANQDPSFEALVQNRLQQFLQTSSQQNPHQLRNPASDVAFPDRTKQFASEVASRSPLLAAYVQGLDSFTARGGQNGSAQTPPGVTNPMGDFLMGGRSRQEPATHRRDESFLDPNQLGAIYRTEEPVRENRLLRLMSESTPPLDWGREEMPSDPLTALQQFAGHELPKGGVEEVKEREQNEALRREFTRLIELQSQSTGVGPNDTGVCPHDGMQTQPAFMNLFRPSNQDANQLEGSREFKMGDWNFH